MKRFYLYILITLAFGAFVSCVKSTEKYAQKEHGKQFGSWEMRYNAGDYDVYWPSLALSERVKGTLCEVVTNRHWWTGNVLSRDTTSSAAFFKAKIYSVKSKNDAKYYNAIGISVSNQDNECRPRLKHRFVFNEGQKDSLSFSMKADEKNYFWPERERSEQIIGLLSGRKPVNMMVYYSGKDVEGSYSFVIDGCPKLKKGLELNQERKIIANKEFTKADRKSQKEFMDLFD